MSKTQSKKQEKKEPKKGYMIHKYYRIEGDKIVRNLRKCQRCSAFMAHHKERERWACGSCGYTEYLGK